jgi:hypothetical protein
VEKDATEKNIEDSDTPLASADGEGFPAWLIAAIAAAIVLIGGIILIAAKRRKRQEEEA